MLTLFVGTELGIYKTEKSVYFFIFGTGHMVQNMENDGIFDFSISLRTAQHWVDKQYTDPWEAGQKNYPNF